ncbi:MAG: hypothetical protein RR297_11595 [Clostridia bacterium]
MKKFRPLAVFFLALLTACIIVIPALAEGEASDTFNWNWTEVLSYLLYGVLTVVSAIVTKYVVPWLKTVTAEKTAKIKNDKIRTGLDEALDAVLTAVTFTNQTYVESLKNKNIFDAEAQKTAFTKSWCMAEALLTETAKNALVAIYGGVDGWLTAKIEQTTHDVKKGHSIVEMTSAVGANG